jgi:hypothetical protein
MPEINYHFTYVREREREKDALSRPFVSTKREEV